MKWYLWVLLILEFILGVTLFPNQYLGLALILLTTALVGFLGWAENKTITLRHTLLLALFIALAVVGRFIFAPAAGFKPVSALSIIVGLYLGPLMGFLHGSLSGLLSNFYFGQGPWTPFQMMAWGSIGYLAGILRSQLKNRLALYLFGIFSAIFYSFFMDIWTVLALGEGFTFRMYLLKLVSAIPTTITYILSNVFFLAVLDKPLAKRIQRMETKFGMERL